MSTFDGKVAEFPDIRIDYFRLANAQTRPPLAYFLSHVHSDHLTGLESCKSPFIYCSPGTRDILLRLEKYPHRMNFAKGILETRKQTYRHLKNLLKAIPLETPTVIELSPGNEIRVTLFDANHCVGAVMFLIEGGGKAVLYTGDIRSEAWWVNSLTRHPCLLPYFCSTNLTQRSRLDCIYLDTTFVVTGKEDPYRYFPSKAEGLRELLQKVDQYPKDTLFYFDSWTFGYEDVWQALSNYLGSRIHVDDYRYGLYRALANGVEPKAPEAVKMVGFHCGNHYQDGYLTKHPTRLHSCEKGTGCDIWSKDFVRITPIIARHKGAEMAELGAGGGQGDLNQQHELEVGDTALVGQLMSMCVTKLQGQTKLLSNVLQLLSSIINDRVQSITIDDFNLMAEKGQAGGEDVEMADIEGMPLEKVVPALARMVTKTKQNIAQDKNTTRLTSTSIRADGLPKAITFPYSRHSSYEELCLLIEAFKPRNVFPCTVDEANWKPTSSMNFLFGHLYNTPQSFSHDQRMLRRARHGTEARTETVRPTSAGSSESDYATADSGPRRSPRRGIVPARIAESGSAARQSQLASRTLEPVKMSSLKRKRSDRAVKTGDQSRGDIDHYSPPRNRIKSSSPSVLGNSEVKVHGDCGAPIPDLGVGYQNGNPPAFYDRPDRFTSSTKSIPAHWRAEQGQPRDQNLLESTCGRLSPPPKVITRESTSSEPEDRIHDLYRPRPGYEARRPSQLGPARKGLSASSPVNHTMAFRREAFQAALSSDGHEWSDVGLVSVSGHQVKEEEL